MDPSMLLMFARDNKHKEIRAAVALGVPVATANQMGQTALHIAALWGNVEAIDVLLELGCDANIQNSRGTTPLHFAANAKREAEEACALLLRHGAKTDHVDMSGRVPFECANSDTVRTMLGGPDKRLFQYCDEGRAADLRELLAAGTSASVIVVDTEGRTPLNLAVAAGSLETMQVLLEHDPKCIMAADDAGDTALHVAVEVNNLKALEYLLSLTDPPANVNQRNLNTSEYSSGNWILHGEPLAPLDKTALHVAVEAGSADCVRALLQKGADPNVLDFDKASALHLALEAQDVDVIRLLLDGGADVNQANVDFTSPLHFAASRGPLEVLQLLLARNADVGVVNSDGWSPLMLAARGGFADKAAVLIDAGMALQAANQQGNTALHLAAVNGKAAVAKLLLDRGADPGATNQEGKTPADVAKSTELAELLRQGTA